MIALFARTWFLPDILVGREDGQDMVEYALLLGLISVGAITVIVLVGPYLSGLFSYIVQMLGTA